MNAQLTLDDSVLLPPLTRHAATNADGNKMLLQDRAAHDWYRFVLSYPPHLVRNFVERFDLDTHHQVLDPFCGTGTTVVECKKLEPVMNFEGLASVLFVCLPASLIRVTFRMMNGPLSPRT